MHTLTPFPDADKHPFKERFVERYSLLTDFEAFKKYSLSFLRRSIRVNTLKISVKELQKRLEDEWNLAQIPWCKEGFWIEHKAKERRDIGNLLEHHLGYFYVQEAASMIPPLVLEPQAGEAVLDMCAAPGSKTTEMAALMQNEGMIVANELSGMRAAALGVNLQRNGVRNVVVTLTPGFAFKGFQFDGILVDAPCSGTGTIRTSVRTIETWNPDVCRRLAGQQKGLLKTAFENLKEGGVVVYSTCTMEPDEDEGVVGWLLNRFENAKLEKIELEGLKRSPAVEEFEGQQYSPEVKKCLRIWPQDNDTEGFFVAKIRNE